MSDSTASGVSRRSFIGGAAAGVAVVTASTVPMLHASATPDDDDNDTVELAQPVVARVRDLQTGEVTLYVGTEEVSITDRTLARRLARAAAR